MASRQSMSLLMEFLASVLSRAPSVPKPVADAFSAAPLNQPIRIARKRFFDAFVAWAHGASVDFDALSRITHARFNSQIRGESWDGVSLCSVVTRGVRPMFTSPFTDLQPKESWWINVDALEEWLLNAHFWWICPSETELFQAEAWRVASHSHSLTQSTFLSMFPPSIQQQHGSDPSFLLWWFVHALSSRVTYQGVRRAPLPNEPSSQSVELEGLEVVGAEVVDSQMPIDPWSSNWSPAIACAVLRVCVYLATGGVDVVQTKDWDMGGCGISAQEWAAALSHACKTAAAVHAVRFTSPGGAATLASVVFTLNKQQ